MVKALRQPRRLWCAEIPILFIAWAGWYLVAWLANPVGDLEETVNGNVAIDLFRGLVAPVWYYQYRPWAHGPLIMGLLLSPLYALFGSSMAWIKIGAACFAAGGTVVWTAIIRRGWGRETAALFLLWWLFPPPYLGRMLHVTWANHMETIFLGGLIIWLFLRSDKLAPGPAGIFGQGMLAGLAVLFCNQAAAFTATVVCLLPWRWGRRSLRLLPLYVTGFILGFSPHFHFKSVISPTGSLLAKHFPGWERIWELFLVAMPSAPGYSVRWASLFAAGLMGAGFLVLLARLRRPIDLATQEIWNEVWLNRTLVLVLAFWLLAYGVGSHRIEWPRNPYWHRYLLPLFPLGMAAACRALTLFRSRHVAALVLVPLCAMSFIDQKPRETAERAYQKIRGGDVISKMSVMRGDRYSWFVQENLPGFWGGVVSGGWVLPAGYAERNAGVPEAFVPDPDRAIRTISELPSEWIPTGYEILGRWLGSDLAISLLRDQPFRFDHFRDQIAMGAGEAAAHEAMAARPDLDLAIERLREAFRGMREADPERVDSFVVGLGRMITEGLNNSPGLKRNRDLLLGDTAGEDDPSPDAKWVVWMTFIHDIARRLPIEVPPEHHGSLVRGAGINLGNMWYGTNEESNPFEIWCDLTEISECHSLAPKYVEGHAEGIAEFVLSQFNFVSLYDLKGTDPEQVRRALKERGVSLVPVGSPPNGWIVERPDVAGYKERDP